MSLLTIGFPKLDDGFVFHQKDTKDNNEMSSTNMVTDWHMNDHIGTFPDRSSGY